MYELSPKAAKVFSEELKQVRDYYAKLYGWKEKKSKGNKSKEK